MLNQIKILWNRLNVRLEWINNILLDSHYYIPEYYDRWRATHTTSTFWRTEPENKHQPRKLYVQPPIPHHHLDWINGEPFNG